MTEEVRTTRVISRLTRIFLETQRILTWELDDKYKFITANTTAEHIFWGVMGFYCIDFLRYWAHRIGHWAFFYKSFPFSRECPLDSILFVSHSFIIQMLIITIKSLSLLSRPPCLHLFISLHLRLFFLWLLWVCSDFIRQALLRMGSPCFLM